MMEDSTSTAGTDEPAPPAKRPRLSEKLTATVQPRSNDKPVPYIKEEEVGITQYISSHSGIFAILKQR